MSSKTDFTEHFFTTSDGPRIHYRDYPPKGETTGLPVLCLHGLTRNVRDFEDIAPRIAAMGRRVIVASQRGRGRSDADPQPDRYRPPVYAADMLGLLDELGIERAVFVGTSMGGLMTMVVAGTQKHRIAAAVINDIGPEIAAPGLDRIRANIAGRDPVDSWQAAASRNRNANLPAFPKRETDDAFWLDFARKTWIEREDGRIELDYDGAIVTSVDGDDKLQTIWDLWAAFSDIPTLLVRGGITDLLAVDTVERMRAEKPDLDVVEVPDVGHAPFMTEPEAWTAVERFLKRVD